MKITNQSNYTRRQALQDLMKAENNNDDAVASLKIVVDSLQEGESLQDATGGFIKLLKRFGNGNTPQAQAAYQQVDRRVAIGENRDEGVQSYLELVNAENKNEDASGNFESVDRAVDRGRNRGESTDAFNNLLRGIGNGNTPEVRKHYGMVVDSLRETDSIGTTIQDLRSLLSAENEREQGVQGYRAIDGSLLPQESRSEATQDYLTILNSLGNGNTPDILKSYAEVDRHVQNGADRTETTASFVSNVRTVGRQNSPIAIESFATVADSVSPEETLNSALSTFTDLVRSENKPEDGLSGYRLIDSSLQDGESRSVATDSFVSLVSAFGNGNTPNIHKAYDTVDQRVRRGEDRSVATENFLKNFRAENKPEDAFTNFEIISSAVDKGIERTEATQEFNNLLSAMGNGNTPNVGKHFRMVLDSLKKEEGLGDALSLHRAILNAENETDDVVSGYRLVNSVVSDKVSRADATEYYVSLLSEYGNGNTPAAQKAFRDTHELILGE